MHRGKISQGSNKYVYGHASIIVHHKKEFYGQENFTVELRGLSFLGLAVQLVLEVVIISLVR